MTIVAQRCFAHAFSNRWFAEDFLKAGTAGSLRQLEHAESGMRNKPTFILSCVAAFVVAVSTLSPSARGQQFSLPDLLTTSPNATNPSGATSNTDGLGVAATETRAVSNSSETTLSQGRSTQPEGASTGLNPDFKNTLDTAKDLTPRSLQSGGFTPRMSRGRLSSMGQLGDRQLSNTAGQEHRIYDLRPYTDALKNYDRPERAIVDWILRETGSELWFSEPFGFMNVNRDQLSVYHTPEMQRLVQGVVERFVEGEKDPQLLSMRIVRVSSPTWRNAAYPLMQHVNVESPGVQAWLLSKENAALVMNQLRQRPDAEQRQEMNMAVHNGQTGKVIDIRGRNYIRSYRPSQSGWPPYEPDTGELHEGYKLSISPLLSKDSRVIDCVIEADIDQVDKLNPVDLELPVQGGQSYRGRIEVPQLVSWRLKERFRWPSDMVLLLSCGVVAHPEGQGNISIPLLNLDALTGNTSGRADALLFVQFRGRASESLVSTPRGSAGATSGATSGQGLERTQEPRVGQNPGINRGRY